MRRTAKVILSKLNFALHRNPRVPKYKIQDAKRYIPDSYKSVLLISSDFELAWAWRFAKGFKNPYVEAISHARIARKNIPRILNLCEEYRIPITWAAVGHLFLSGCDKNGHLAHSHMQRIPYHENDYWKYDRGDWFDDDPCSDWNKSPEWYAPDLVKIILGTNVKHEIACHTFSHIDCSDKFCTPSVLASEVQDCKKSASLYGVDMKTFVHPGHTIGNLKTLYELGFKSFRTDYMNVLDHPQMHDSGLWEFKSTMEFVYKREWSIDYHVHRYTEIIDRALASHRLCLFWFHPSIDSTFVREIMPRIFSYVNSSRQILWVTTIQEYVSWLDRAKSV
jgi:hypothetical protein